MSLLNVYTMVDYRADTNLSLDEDEVLNGDIYGMIAPYGTANYWVWSPAFKKRLPY